MAVVKFDTFPNTPERIYLHRESLQLQKKIRWALRNICLHPIDKNNEVVAPPFKLNPQRDWLKPNYREIWKQCVIEYDENDPNASAYHSLNKITVGPVFLRPTITILDMEKVLLHEFLHLALWISNRDVHHSFMEQIITHHMKYDGDANPFCPL